MLYFLVFKKKIFKKRLRIAIKLTDVVDRELKNPMGSNFDDFHLVEYSF